MGFISDSGRMKIKFRQIWANEAAGGMKRYLPLHTELCAWRREFRMAAFT